MRIKSLYLNTQNINGSWGSASAKDEKVVRGGDDTRIRNERTRERESERS